MAKITETKPGVWQVYARFKGKAQRLRFSRYNCKNRDPYAAAMKCYREFCKLEEAWKGRTKRTLLADFIPQYIRFTAIENAPATVKSDKGRLRIFHEWCLREGIKYLDEITVAVFDRFKLYFHEERGGTNPNNYISVVSALLSHAVRHDLLKKNPLSRYPKKRLRIDESDYFELDEIDRLLANADIPYPRYFLMFILNLGLRLGELMHLMWDDISTPSSPKQLPDGRPYFGQVRIVSRELNSTKSGKTRVLPVTGKLYPVIKDLEAGQRLTYVFDNGHNEPLYRSKQWHLILFKRLAQRAGVTLTRPGRSRPRTLKTLRDSFATYLIDSGVSMFTVSQLLGHSSVRVTEKHYVHLIPGSLDAVNKLPY